MPRSRSTRLRWRAGRVGPRVPPSVYGRLERNEPSAWEKTRTAHIVPPTERAMDDEGAVEIEEVLSLLNQGGGSATILEDDEPESIEVDEARGQSGDEANHDAETINEVTSSGMFALDGPPDVADVDKLRFACDAVREGAGDDGGAGPRTLLFAKTFPTLLPFGVGGPRPVEEAAVQLGRGTADIREREAATRELVSSRNMSLRTWADTVLRRHGGRFATHHIFAFLVFNIGVRSRNRRVSMLSVTRKNFRKVERIVRSLTADGLAAARAELESTGKTTDDAVKELLRSLSLYGYRQPMSREVRLGMRHRILALIVRYGVPAIWFTINPNDITNPVKLRLAAYRARDPEAAEEFLRSLDKAFKRVRLSVSDPMSSAVFFHREMTLFFEHYVNAGGESVFGRVSQYYGAVETNERGSLHVHGLLWLEGNAHLSSMLADSDGGEQAAYRERIVRYVDSVFSEDLDQEGFCAVEAERSVTSDISSLLNRADQFSASKGRKGADLCRFKAPWERVEETTLSADGVLRIRRTHPMVNRWNKAIAVGLRHNHDISFIATQRKTMALVYYVTNYATKVEDPTWKRVAAAAELLPVVSAGSQPGAGDDTRQFLMRVANRVFTERALSQVEVVAHLLGHPSEFSGSSAWAYLNVSVLYWHVSRLWRHLRQQSGTAAVEDVSVADESVVVEQAGERISFAEAYHHRGHVLRGLCLYDYVSLVRLQRVGKAGCSGGWGEVPFESGWVAGKDWVQVLRRPERRRGIGSSQGCRPASCAICAVEAFLGEEEGTSMRYGGGRELLPPRISCLVDNVQLLRRSAEDARRDAKQWAASGGAGDCAGALGEAGGGGGGGRHPGDDDAASAYQADNGGKATRLIDVVRSAAGANQITAGSRELGNGAEAHRLAGAGLFRGRGAAAGPGQGHQVAADERLEGEVKMIQGIQSMATAHGTDRGAAERSVLTGFGEEGVQITAAEAEETAAIALSIICRHLDLMRRGDGGGDVSQLCQFVGGEGGTGKSRVIEALAERFVDGESRMDWQDKEVLVIDEVSMLGARTLHAVNERLCQLRGSQRDFGGIPIVLFCGDFHQFRPVQERSILLPSSAVSWDEDYSFRAEQRHQHDKAHAL
ncbi:PIF1-like helicase domain-containing protein [Hirsutella rhossiliensis]|uniref:ATP-dependent DNA helicase n=1 Tax=Hirsutella rhossiliensis TaxID=111463 RepID=A0A9P8SCQ3_9HYPO|nr:PIF1-like helicase domain-containing protein [Hirsutella rhossiliensis]KAH0957124.1 PIF1-like helicase domain-containing protein [Hirsutella rhossiliensis]